MSTKLDSRAVGVVTCATIAIVLATFMVILRFITRIRILNFVGADDWCIGIALMFSMCNSVAMSLEAKYALGKQLDRVSGQQYDDFLHGFYFSIISYSISLIFTKISTLLLYIRLFKSSNIRYGCYILLGVVITYGAWLLFSSIFPCVPVEAFWDENLPGHCLPHQPTWFTNALLNIATDVAIFILPLRVIRSLNLPKRQKLGLYFVFALGFFVCIISLIRLYSLHIAATTADPTQNNIGMAIWSCIEINTALICSSLITLKPLISRVFPNLLPSADIQFDQISTGNDARSNKNDSRFAMGTIGRSRSHN